MSFEGNYYNQTFSHIYVEKKIKEHCRTRGILEQFPESRVIEIDHYKDVFCRRGQNPQLQSKGKALILASKEGRLVYDGAKVCQSFDNEYFYYTSCVMNCMFDCEYCYLKGMYPSGHMVIFVNLEDIFSEVEEILQKHSAYICVSYDTDLIAVESLTDFVKCWIDFAKKHENLNVEIRTKAGRMDLWERYNTNKNVIFAFTLSPQYVVERCEHGTASLTSRLQSASRAMELGYSVRLCFDPMIYCPDWKHHYEEMLEQVFLQIDMTKLTDVSVGSFRISQDYLKKMRRNAPDSQVVQFPYQNVGGVYQYPPQLREEMEQYLVERLLDYMPEERIFRWE